MGDENSCIDGVASDLPHDTKAVQETFSAHPEHLLIAHVLLDAKNLLRLFHRQLPRSRRCFEGFLRDPLPLRICTPAHITCHNCAHLCWCVCCSLIQCLQAL